MSTKTNLRDAVLSKAPKFKSVEKEFEGNQFLLRQLSVKDRTTVLNKSTKGEKFDPYEFLVWSTIYCTFDPETNTRVFEESDYAALVEMPAGGFVDVLGGEASKLITSDEGKD